MLDMGRMPGYMTASQERGSCLKIFKIIEVWSAKKNTSESKYPELSIVVVEWVMPTEI